MGGGIEGGTFQFHEDEVRLFCLELLVQWKDQVESRSQKLQRRQKSQQDKSWARGRQFEPGQDQDTRVRQCRTSLNWSLDCSIVAKETLAHQTAEVRLRETVTIPECFYETVDWHTCLPILFLGILLHCH